MSGEELFDEQVDLVSEGVTGLREPDEADLAADFEDRMVEDESLTKASETDDQDKSEEEERFAYTLEDGSVIEGTFAEILDKASKANLDPLQNQINELQAKLEEAEKGSGKIQETANLPDIEPVKWESVGSNLEIMLSGGDPEQNIPGPEGIGPALQDLQMRSFLTDPRYAQIIMAAVDGILEQRESAVKEASAFKEMVGDGFRESEIADFQKSHPHLKTRNEVVMGLRLAKMQQEMADLKSGKTKEVTEAERKGAAKTIKDLKAKGQLRRISGTRTNMGAKSPPKDENSIRAAWAADLGRRLGSG